MDGRQKRLPQLSPSRATSRRVGLPNCTDIEAVLLLPIDLVIVLPADDRARDMSRVSYFQRFSQPENHATNNTLLVLRYLYELSPVRLQRLLTSLLDVELAVGLSFEQQVRMGHGVPDALISQAPLRIFIETKRGGHLDVEQITRHCKGIAAAGKRPGDVLIGLTKEALAEQNRIALEAVAGEHGVAFVATTFTRIANALRRECADYERELHALVDDFAAFLTEEGLMDERSRWMFVNPCGISYEENVRFSLYYEPPSRRLASNSRYLGIYKNKLVSHVGVITAIAIATIGEDGKQAFKVEAGTLTEEHKTRISDVIAATAYYELADGPCRFYLADKIEPTRVVKTSAGGIRGRTYLDIPKLVATREDKPRATWSNRAECTSLELAELLEGSTWE